MSFYTRFRLLCLAMITVLLLVGLTQVRTLPAAAASSFAAPTATPVAPTTPEPPAVVARANANIRSGPGTAYQVIGGARVGQRLPVLGRAKDWWQVTLGARTGWIWGGLATANAAARQAPEIANLPPVPSKAPAVAPAPQPVALPDLVVLGPDTRYPVRAKIVRGWSYEFIDDSAAYDFVVQRDVFGMLAHQLDDERVTRYRKPSFFSFTPDGVLRIHLVDWAPHPNPDCAAQGYGMTDRVDFGGDPLGLNTNACIDNRSLYPLVDGQGAAIGYRCNGVCAFAVAGPGANVQSLMLTAFGEALPRPPLLSPVDRADFSGPFYRPLGEAHWDATFWRWSDPFVEVVPAGR